MMVLTGIAFWTWWFQSRSKTRYTIQEIRYLQKYDDVSVCRNTNAEMNLIERVQFYINVF